MVDGPRTAARTVWSNQSDSYELRQRGLAILHDLGRDDLEAGKLAKSSCDSSCSRKTSKEALGPRTFARTPAS